MHLISTPNFKIPPGQQICMQYVMDSYDEKQKIKSERL